jgi:hypothetical protein
MTAATPLIAHPSLGNCGARTRDQLEVVEAKGKVMKRNRLHVLLGSAAMVLPFGVLPGVANATGGDTTSSTSVSIKSTADYDFTGTNVDVGYNIRCYGGSGTVTVWLEQFPPETPYPVGEGSSANIVACDGRSHSGSATVVGAVFDAGRAKATVTVMAPSGNKTVSSWVTIRQ